MSAELRKEYDSLVIEKAELERGIGRKRQKIQKLLADIKTLHNMHEEEEAKSDLIGGYSEDDWDLEALWCEGSVEEMQAIIVALKQQRAAISAECSDVSEKLKNLQKSS